MKASWLRHTLFMEHRQCLHYILMAISYVGLFSYFLLQKVFFLDFKSTFKDWICDIKNLTLCGGTAAALRRHCGGTAAALWRHCGGTAAALRRHCGGTARHCGGTAAVLRQYCGGTAAEPRRHCGSTAVALRRHCGGHCGTSMALRWHCNGTEAALRRHREDTAAALYYCTGCHKNDYKDLHSGLARSTICTHMTTYHSDMMEEKILSFI
jgi:hypothetical protein